jgi:hypothetical protein
MTEAQEAMILDLAKRRIAPSEFLQKFCGGTDGQLLARELLQKAIVDRNASDVDLSMLVMWRFGVAPAHFDVLCELSDAAWHMMHEDVVSALNKLQDSRAIEVVNRAAYASHAYVAYDDARALAVKAIWALGNMRHPLADEKLNALAQSDHPIVRKNAMEQLERRHL